MKWSLLLLAAMGMVGVVGCDNCKDCRWPPHTPLYMAEIVLEADTVDFAAGDSVFVNGWVTIRDDSECGVRDQQVTVAVDQSGGWIEYTDPAWYDISNDSGRVNFRYHARVTVCETLRWFTASADEARPDGRRVVLMVREEAGTADFDSLTVAIIPDTLYELPPENTFLPRVEMRLFRNGQPAAAGLECVGYRVRLLPSVGELPWQDFTATNSTGLSYQHWQLLRTPGLYCLTYPSTGDTAACAVILPGHRP